MIDLSKVSLTDLLAEVDRRTSELRAMAEKEARRKYDAERQRKSRAAREQRTPQTNAVENNQTSQPGHTNVTPNVTEKHVTSEGGVTSTSQPGHTNVTEAPSLPPSPPFPPAPPHTYAPAHESPPTVEEIARFAVGQMLAVEPAERPAVAQAYHDNRASHDPPWHRPALHHRPPAPIGDWRPDFRQFCSGWKRVENEQAARKPKPINGTHLKTSGPAGRIHDRNAGTANAGNTSDYSRVGKVA